MNAFDRFLYNFGIKKPSFNQLELWASSEQWSNLEFCLTLDDILIQEKAFKLIAANCTPHLLPKLCSFASTCPWQLNHTVYTILLNLFNEEQYSRIKEQKQQLIQHMEEALSSEKVERPKEEETGRELPSDRLRQQLKEHRSFMSKGLKVFKKR